MEYRPEIDGLRALAVLPVIFFHAGFQTFSGGFVGVDVFFVISGYLITTIILADLESGEFSIINFYERRARRILPALFLVVLVCIPLAWVFLSRADLSSFSKSLVAVSLFLSNIFFWRDGGYFETVAELKPLLHTWSLAVEEQYYLLFPLFLILAKKLGRRWTYCLLVLTAVVSLIAAQWGAIHKPLAAFFLLPTRAWELAIGALIALHCSSQDKGNVSGRTKQVLSISGLMLIIGAVFTVDKETPFPSFYALVPTFGAALIILYGTSNTLIGALLGHKVFVGVGLISYSAYLWHLPLFAFARNHFQNQNDKLMLILSVTSLILAAMSWRFIEKPFRNRQSISRCVVFMFSVIGSLFFMAIGFSSSYFLGSSSVSVDESELAGLLTKHKAVYASNFNDRKFIKYRIKYESLTPDLIVVGSSRIMQIGEHNLKDKVLNLGVSGSSVEDDVAITYMALKKFSPTTLLISADPWLFSSESRHNRWKSLDAEYHQAISLIMSSTNMRHAELSARGSEDTNEEHLPTVAEVIYRAINVSKSYSEDDAPSLTRDKIRRDGSRVYNISFSKKSQYEIERGFKDFLKGNYSFSQESYDNFEKFLVHYRDKKKIFLVLSPYHPKLYSLMKSDKKIYLDVEEQYRDLAKRIGIKVIGSYDPDRVGCSEGDFYDGVHPKDICMERVVSELRVQ